MAFILAGHVLAAVMAAVLVQAGRMLVCLAVHFVPRHRARGSRKRSRLSGSKRCRAEHDDHFNSPEFEWISFEAQAILGGGVAVSGWSP
jgi:hypothetical protein